MFRALSILAAVAALAVAAAPVTSAGTSKKPPPRGTAKAPQPHVSYYTHVLEDAIIVSFKPKPKPKPAGVLAEEMTEELHALRA